MSETITVNFVLFFVDSKKLMNLYFFFIFICREVMIKQFFDFYDYYVDVCTDNTNKDGQQMTVEMI